MCRSEAKYNPSVRVLLHIHRYFNRDCPFAMLWAVARELDFRYVRCYNHGRVVHAAEIV